MSGEKTFGAWLLEQQARQDTTGTLARAWYALKEARGYNRHTRAKSIRELMSSSLGEDWTGLHGDEAVDSAEAEWKASGTEQVDYAVQAARDYNGAQQLPIPNMGGSVQMINYMEQAQNTPAPMAVLVFDGHRYELTPGRQYELRINPVLRDATGEDLSPTQAQLDAKPSGDITLTGEPNLTVLARPDGGYDWEALYALADRDLPEFFDLRSLPEASE